MIGNLENSFDELLDNEASRILGRLLIMYEEKKKVNKSTERLIRSLAKKEYKYF